MRYKDYYPTFWVYWKNEALNGSKLSEARKKGRLAFLKAFYYVFKWDCKLSGFKKTAHDMFIGTRVL